MDRKLTAKQEMFCLEYLKDLNAKQAAIRAGYAESGAEVRGSELLSNRKVAERVAELKGQRSSRTKIDADWLLLQLGDEALADMADLYDETTGALRPIHQWPKIWRQGLVSGLDVNELSVDGKSVGQVVKIKIADRTRIKELIGKHVDVKAWEREETGAADDIASALSKLADKLPG